MTLALKPKIRSAGHAGYTKQIVCFYAKMDELSRHALKVLNDASIGSLEGDNLLFFRQRLEQLIIRINRFHGAVQNAEIGRTSDQRPYYETFEKTAVNRALSSVGYQCKRIISRYESLTEGADQALKSTIDAKSGDLLKLLINQDKAMLATRLFFLTPSQDGLIRFANLLQTVDNDEDFDFWTPHQNQEKAKLTKRLSEIHPGKLIEKYLIDNEWSVIYAAERLGVTRGLVYNLIRGTTGISTSMARALERNQIGGTALDWLILQAKFDLAQPERPLTPQRRVSRQPEN